MLKTIQGKVNTLVDYARLAHDINGYRVWHTAEGGVNLSWTGIPSRGRNRDKLPENEVASSSSIDTGLAQSGKVFEFHGESLIVLKFLCKSLNFLQLGMLWPGARFSKVPIINGPVKLFWFTCKIEVS